MADWGISLDFTSFLLALETIMVCSVAYMNLALSKNSMGVELPYLLHKTCILFHPVCSFLSYFSSVTVQTFGLWKKEIY